MAGLSRTAKFYRKNPDARKKHVEYQKKYNSSKKEIDRRVELNRERRKRKLKGDPRDIGHKKDGTLKLTSRAANRGRYDANGVNAVNRRKSQRKNRSK